VKKTITTILFGLLMYNYASSQTADVGTVTIISPQSECQMGNEPIKAEIRNYGHDTNAVNLAVRYSINGNNPVSQTQPYAAFNQNDTKIVTFTQNGNFSAAGTYLLKVWTDMGNDQDRSNDTLSAIIENYTPTIAGTLLKDTTLCQRENYTLRIENANGTVAGWEYSDDNGAIWVELSNSDNPFVVYDIPNTRLYRALMQNGTCPPVYTNEVNITVIPGPMAGEIKDDRSACGGFVQDTLILENYIGSIVTWEENIGSGWVDLNHTDDTLILQNINVSTQYRAIVSNNSCPNDTTPIVNLNVINDTDVGELGANDWVCLEANEGLITLSNHIGDITKWEKSTNIGGDWQDILHSEASLEFLNLTESTWYRVLVEGFNCSSKYSDTVMIHTYSAAVDIAAASATGFCLGDSVRLDAVPTDHSTYSWNIGANSSDIVVDSSSWYTVSIVDSNNCVASDSILVTVFDLPIIYAGNDTTISLGEEAFLVATGGENYEWSPSTYLDNPFIADPRSSAADSIKYTVVGTDTNGCVSSDTVNVYTMKNYKFTYMNTITPNGDGFNDVWVIENVEAYPESEIIILNRYGDLVHEQSAYQNDWKGTSSGKQLPDGVYYYVFMIPNSPFETVKGHINLLTK
jgi:gliding motility-associated-like protein